MPRINQLADPDFAQNVAELFAAGLSRAQMCEELGVRDRATITRWRRDPRVRARALKIIEDRVLQVTRRVDSSIARRLQDADKLTVRELLDIRREFLGGALRAQTERADDATINETMAALESNPDLMAGIERLLANPSRIPGGVGDGSD